jgi:hypothetical protein
MAAICAVRSIIAAAGLGRSRRRRYDRSDGDVLLQKAAKELPGLRTAGLDRQLGAGDEPSFTPQSSREPGSIHAHSP